MTQRKVQFSFIMLIGFTLGSCSYQGDILEVDDSNMQPNLKSETIQSSSESPNVLLIIADDMGHDATPGFSEGISKPSMPNLENMMSGGVTFEMYGQRQFVRQPVLQYQLGNMGKVREY